MLLETACAFLTGSLKSRYFTLLKITCLSLRPSSLYFLWTRGVEGELRRAPTLAICFPACCSYASQAVDCLFFLGGEFMVFFTFWLFLLESIIKYCKKIILYSLDSISWYSQGYMKLFLNKGTEKNCFEKWTSSLGR